MPPLHMIDISNNQGKAMDRAGVPLTRILDWAKEAGTTSVCFKVSEGEHSGDGGPKESDQRYIRVWRDYAHEIGFDSVGLYHWVSPNGDPRRQLENFKRWTGGLRDREYVQLDNEDPGRIPDAIAQGCIDVWEDAFPGRNYLYVGWFYLLGQLKRLHVPPGSWWWPAYIGAKFQTYEEAKHALGVDQDAAIWQWGGGAQGAVFPDLGARVDSNEVRDWDSLHRHAGIVVTSHLGQSVPIIATPAPAPTPIATPNPSGEDLMLAILVPEGRNARFLATMHHQENGNWLAYRADWVRSPDELAPFVNAGAKEWPVPVEAFRNIAVDAVPANDGWTEADFRRVG